MILEARLTYPQGRVVVVSGSTKEEVLTKIKKVLEDNTGFTCLKVSVDVHLPNYRRVGSA